MFSEQIARQAIPLFGDISALVVDDALANPDALVRFAERTRAAFDHAPDDVYPGVELRMADAFSAKIDHFFRLQLRRHFDARRTLSHGSFLRLTTLKPEEMRAAQWLPRREPVGESTDEGVVYYTLYLFHDPHLGGTGFYEPKCSARELARLERDAQAITDAEFQSRYGVDRGYCTASNEYVRLAQVVPARYNRLVLFEGSVLNAPHVEAIDKLSLDPALGRLTLSGHFQIRRNASRFANRLPSKA